MTDFRVPPGDPDGLRGVVGRLSKLAGTVGETRDGRLRTAGEDAAAGLPVARVAAFAAVRQDASRATGAIGLSLVAVGGALADYADALENAQRTVRDAATRYARAETLWQRARMTGEVQLATESRQDMNREARRAGHAQADLATAVTRTTAALSAETDVWAPGAGTLTPVQAWERATAAMLPGAVHIDPQRLRDLFKNPDVTLAPESAVNLLKAGTKGFQLYGVVSYLHTPALSARAEAKLLTARDLYQKLKGSAPTSAIPGSTGTT